MHPFDNFHNWLGNQAHSTATIAVETANLMNATLNREPTLTTGDPLPSAWHWLYFHEAVQREDLGIEGHAKLGGFMPPISFGDDAGGDPDSEPPRRMWAGGKLTFHAPIALGSQAEKQSTITSVTPKEGLSGKLVFVVVEHEIAIAGQTCLTEEQTIVYREPVQSNGSGVQAKSAPTDAEFSRAYQPDPMLLFRYSALTFNAHRIHYDVDFCREHEGYPDLVVHGPLTATLLLDLFYHRFPSKQISQFEYRGRSPLFNPHPFSVNGKENGAAWASDHQGGLATSAQVSFAG